MDIILPLIVSIALAAISIFLFITFFIGYKKELLYDYESELQDDSKILISELIRGDEEYRNELEKRIKKLEKKLKELEEKIEKGHFGK